MERNNRDRIIEAAATLLTEGGRDAVSTRAVSAAAGVQAPTIYRIFGDKQGLLDAVGAYGMATYLRSKAANPVTDDPVADLRRGWDLHVDFGLANPAFYTLIYGDQRPGTEPPAAREAAAILAGLIRRVAEAGRLRIGEDRAANLVHAAGLGTTLMLIAQPVDRRDLALSAIARDSIIATVTTESYRDTAADGPVAHALALRAALPGTTALTERERGLLGEWLDRIVAAQSPA
ncbi:TetR/AcrR family transcriptional regulator [Actinophytocola xanthii]|uniref:TetR family transcriptional regulator n=1 Tax=Actinophytocola xanthii TaxID=1912961 RepID=A0A1Q8CYG0_9PSEU|nr:TetR/AcrR family transcriptional regulator [Actinophytocola xanthii]OLF19383.1 TetR family transcriptional regulator [Actinophytocola xanthii]